MERTNKHTRIDELITTFLSQGLGAEERVELDNWIKSSSENKQYFQKMHEVWFSSISASNQKRYEKEKAFDRFLSRTQKLSEEEKDTRKLPLRKLFYSAAAVALLCIISFASYQTGSEQVKKQFAEMIIEAPLGSKTKLYLPDGSLVWLNAGSKISYSQGFGVNNRELKFEGEGYFEVEKNKELPFNIRTQDLNVTVLGTKFNFRNYPEDHEAIVNLMEGRVSLENHLKEMELKYLSPAQKMILNKQTGEIQISSTNETEKTRDWTNNILMFDEELLPDIVRELERSYNIKIRIDNESLKGARFYGYFNQREQNIYDILNILSSTGRITYKMTENNTIVLN